MGLFSSAVSGIFGLAGNGMSANVQRETNEMNYKINQMNNEFNAREAQKNRDFQLDMWNKQNEYNTPSAQFNRMKEAGINPYNAGSSIGSGNSTSSPSGSSASAASPISMQAYRHDFSTISDAINSFFLNQKIALESKGQSIANAFSPDMLRANIAHLIGNQSSPLMNNGRYRNWLLSEPGANLGMSSFRSQVQGQSLNNNLIVANTASTLLSARYQQILNRFAEPQQIAEIFVKTAQFRELESRGVLNQAQVKKMVFDNLKTMAETAGIQLNNRILSETADSIIEVTNLGNYNNSIDLEKSIRYRNSGWNNQGVFNLRQFVKDAIGSILPFSK